jgi:hypothetical protein
MALPAPADAWGANGHRTVGQIAENHLSPRAALEIRELLGGKSLAMAATWADEIKSIDAYDHTHSWHYTSVEDGETYEESAKNPDGDVVETLGRMSKTLADRTAPAAERAAALKWIVHLVGDIHQPLHVGRKGDRGGNEVKVEWFGDRTNLHSVWDSRLIRHKELSFSELADFLDRATLEEIRQWQDAAVHDWAEESQALRPDVYKIGRGDLSWDYVRDHWPTVERRLLRAGIRLAGLLNHLLGDTWAHP